MSSFIKKEISFQETVGQKLVKARKKRGLGIQEIGEEIKINPTYLKALEEGRYEDLPGELYARNFLRVYAKFLGLDFGQLVKLYEKEWLIYFRCFPKNKKNKFRNSFLLPISLRQFALLFSLVILFIVSFLFIKRTFSSPKLVVFYPPDNLITKERVIEIKGRTDKYSYVKINDQKIFCNPEGYFQEEVVLQDGVNIIRIVSAKKNSKEIVILRRIMVQ